MRLVEGVTFAACLACMAALVIALAIVVRHMPPRGSYEQALDCEAMGCRCGATE